MNKEQPIKGWVKATGRKPEKGIFPVKVSNKKNTVTMIGVGLVTIGEFSVIRFLNGTTLQEENNGFDDENIEWLDETIQSGEERLFTLKEMRTALMDGINFESKEAYKSRQFIHPQNFMEQYFKEKFGVLLSSEQNVQASVATEDDQGTEAGKQK